MAKPPAKILPALGTSVQASPFGEVQIVARPLSKPPATNPGPPGATEITAAEAKVLLASGRCRQVNPSPEVHSCVEERVLTKAIKPLAHGITAPIRSRAGDSFHVW